MNKHSYYYKLIEFDKGIFDKYIDMVYILTMENSTRVNHYMKQLTKYKPLKNILIQYNKGFKKCNKKLLKQNTIYDLNDAYYHAFLNAKNNNYKNIIIFEDDFFFDNLNMNDINSIGNFIKYNKYHIYHLGTAVHISIPYTLYHHRAFISVASHGVIYNMCYFDIYINNYNKSLVTQNDMFWNKLDIIKYKYYKPICFQIFEETNNSINWKFSKIGLFFIKLFGINKSHTPGFYILNKLFYFITLLLIMIIYIIYNKLVS